MIKEAITYEDYDGNEVTETFHFNLTKLEMAELELNHAKGSGGLEAHLKRLTEESDGVTVYNLFKEVLLSSVGRKSEDGRRFIKNPEIRADFENSPALSELVFQFLQDPTRASRFIKGVLPTAVQREIDASEKKPASTPAPQTSETDISGEPEQMTKKFEDYTEQELLQMPKEQFDSLLPDKPGMMSKEQMLVSMKRSSQ